MKKTDVELLAPAGDFECVRAAINAGADAVYTGGHKFGARAGATNLNEEELIDAINYVHIHNKRLYLTINTLFKEKEIEEELISYLLPLYNAGLDACIVQDIGVINYIRDRFPGLPVHVSTQATINGANTAKLYENMGVTRIVTPRELSLDEIKAIKKNINIEIESFIHGALCYCYSGQCLLSSMIGGRSGNRGRCAQPCRMEYKNDNIKGDESYLLSTKDMCCIKILPEIIESGVYSLKIEGRMKKPLYVAGVVAIYRKYLDYYIENYDLIKSGKLSYKVSEKDYNDLLSLFNRNGFNESYYKKYNGKDMMSLTKVKFRPEDKELSDRINDLYIKNQRKEPIVLHISIKTEEPISVYAYTDFDNEDGLVINASINGKICEKAKNNSLTKEEVIKQFSKLGNTPFYIKSIEIELDDGLFLSVGELKSLRREIVEKLCDNIMKNYYRDLDVFDSDALSNLKNKKTTDIDNTGIGNTGTKSSCYNDFSVLIRSNEQLDGVLSFADNTKTKLKRVYIESFLLDSLEHGLSTNKDFSDGLKSLNDKKIQIFGALPVFIHKDKREVLIKDINAFLKLGVEGFLVRNFEEVFILSDIINSCNGNTNNDSLNKDLNIKIVLDNNIYSMNKRAARINKSICDALGFETAINLSVECNYNELKCFYDVDNKEYSVYGKTTVMTSANCVRKNTSGCLRANDNKSLNNNDNTICDKNSTYLTDRLNNYFYVFMNCKYCQNTIFNSKPTVLLKYMDDIKGLNIDYLRLDFTDESFDDTINVLKAYISDDNDFANIIEINNEFTRGHFTRGVK